MGNAPIDPLEGTATQRRGAGGSQLRRALALAALLLLTSCSSLQELRAIARTRSYGRHHGAFLGGAEAEFRSGVRVGIEGGRQAPLWLPGEPHTSARAPTGEWQLEGWVSVPVWRRK